MRQIKYRWLGKNWILNVHPPGDSVCDLFHPPHPMEMLPWLLADVSGTFVDIGAHIGSISIHAAPVFKKVVAFEPEPRNLACLRANVAQNRLPNFTVVAKAVADTCGSATFYVNDTIDTGRNSLGARANGTRFEVETVTIDHMFATELASHPPISFIKIDVEGFEPQVLRGAAATLGRQALKPVMKIEFTPSSWSKREQDVYWLFDYLKQSDYVPLFPTCGFISPITIETLRSMYESWKCLNYDSWVDIVLVPSVSATQERIIGTWAKVQNIINTIR